MSNKKTEFHFFDITEYDKEAEYLSAMHSSGWKLDSVYFPGIYRFSECECEKYTYQLDYNKDGIENKDEYVQMFKDLGWEYLFDFVGYSYFRKPASVESAADDIFCDDGSRVDMMNRVFRGRMIPLIVVFFLMIIAGLIKALRGDFPMSISLMLCGVSIVYLVVFFRFIVKYVGYNNRMRK